MTRIPRILAAYAAAVVAACLPAGVAAQAFPSKTLRIIVPFPAGGPADIFARALAQGMGTNLGQTVIIENRAGVGGVLGVDVAIKSAPDGYTLALNSASSVSIAPFSMDKMPYDPKRDFAYLTMVVKVPEVLVVNTSVPASNLTEFLAHLRANAGKVNFGSAGGGTITHLAGELLKAEAKVDAVHVPYKGAAPAVADLLGGQVQFAILDVPVILPHIRAGKLKPLLVTSHIRAPSLPDVPNAKEAGYPKVTSDNWYGLVGPAAIPADIQKRLQAAAHAALKSPELIEQYARVSGIPSPSTTEEYVAFVAEEQAKWGPIVKAIGFRQE